LLTKEKLFKASKKNAEPPGNQHTRKEVQVVQKRGALSSVEQAPHLVEQISHLIESIVYPEI